MMVVGGMLPVPLTRLVTLAESAHLIEAAGLLRQGTDIVVVCSADGLLAGVVTKTDVVGQISQCQGCSCTFALATVMSRDVIVCRPDDRLDEVWLKMKERGLKNIPVTDQDSRPIAMLNARDVLQALLGEVKYEEALLRDYVMTVGYH